MVKNKFESKKKHNESSLLKKKTVLIGLVNICLNYDFNEKSVITRSKLIIKNSKLKLICGIDKSKNKEKFLKKNYQKVVLNNIFNKKGDKNISKITEISYNSFKINDKIIFMI